MRYRTFAAITALWLGAVGCAGSNKSGKPTKQVESESLNDDDALPPFQLKGPKKRVGIVDFEFSSAQGGYSGFTVEPRALAEAAREVTTEALFKTGAYLVVEREQLANVVQEQKLGQTGAISAQSAAKAGKLLGLQAIIAGKITDFNIAKDSAGFGGYFNSSKVTYRARVSLRIIDAVTGEVWAAESGEGTASQKSTTVLGGGGGKVDEGLGKRALYRAIRQMIAKVVAKTDAKPWSGSIAKVGKDGKLYITAGEDIGLPVGAALVARGSGDEITDPATGQVIGRELGKVKGTLQLASHAGNKLSVCISADGGGYAEGDVVTVQDKPAFQGAAPAAAAPVSAPASPAVGGGQVVQASATISAPAGDVAAPAAAEDDGGGKAKGKSKKKKKSKK